LEALQAANVAANGEAGATEVAPELVETGAPAPNVSTADAPDMAEPQPAAPDAPVSDVPAEVAGAEGTRTNLLPEPAELAYPDLPPSSAGDSSFRVTVQPGHTLWAIGNGQFGDGIRYVQVYEANRDAIRDPDIIYPSQVFTIPAV